MAQHSFSFRATAIADYLRPYRDKLHEHYNWKADYSKLKALAGAEVFNATETNLSEFEKVLRMKSALNAKLSSDQISPAEFDKLARWIIRDWGGIYSGTDSDTLKAVREFFKTNTPPFNRIASASKVAAFTEPDKYIIYDSRIAYAVNWILLSRNAGDMFFPIPPGRNSKMKAFDLEVLIHLKHLKLFEVDNLSQLSRNNKHISKTAEKIFVQKPMAYKVMNDLIGEAGDLLYGKEVDQPRFYTQMLLFALADTVICQDLLNSVTLTINGK